MQHDAALAVFRPKTFHEREETCIRRRRLREVNFNTVIGIWLDELKSAGIAVRGAKMAVGLPPFLAYTELADEAHRHFYIARHAGWHRQTCHAFSRNVTPIAINVPSLVSTTALRRGRRLTPVSIFGRAGQEAAIILMRKLAKAIVALE